METDVIEDEVISLVTRPGTYSWLLDVFYVGLLKTRQYKDCLMVVEMLREVAPHWPGCPGLTGLVLAKEGKNIEAIEHLEQNLKNFPDSQMQRYYMASCMRKISHPDWRWIAESVAASEDTVYSGFARRLLGYSTDAEELQCETSDNSGSGWNMAMLRV